MLPKRMPEQTMEEETFTNDTAAERTSEPHIVVACPSCRTKFAVESSLVASYELPRFHCSRCDSIFELQQQPKVAPAPGNAQRWVLSDEPHQGPHNSDSNRASASSSTAPVSSSDFTLGAIPNPDTLEPRAPFEPIEDRAGLSILGFRPTASRRYSTSLTRNETQSLLAQAGVASTETVDPFSLFDAPSTTPAPERPAAAPAQTIDTPAPSTKKPASAGASSSSVEIRQRAPVPTPDPTPSVNKSPLVQRFSERTQGLVRLSAPVLACIGAVCVVSVISRFVPLTMDSVFGAVVPSLITGRTAHLPPPELSVQDLNMHLEKTQSKETIPVIRGYISNSSDKTFEDVSIEALGFNARGELVVRARAPLRSALSREKISDLPLATVKKFQNALSASDASIKGGEKVAFSVALFLQDASPQEVVYFSARVFSVGKSR